MYLDEDRFGNLATCLQCGYVLDFELADADAQAEEEVSNGAVITEDEGVAV